MDSDQITSLLFRLIHITAGVWWAGGVFLFVIFVLPSSGAIAPQGAPFMMELVGRRKLTDRFLQLATVTIAAGVVLYWIRWHEYPNLGDFLATGFGLGLTIGALSAIAAYVLGLVATRPAGKAFMALLGQVQASGQPPTPEVGAQLQAMQKKLATLAKVNLTLVTIAVLCMGTARFW
jgi:uncharacterized membrane protein